ncbi:MAG: lysylphosphatidylglycerol synthase transmembrane domain-containing protein [Terriglobales bacterium]
MERKRFVVYGIVFAVLAFLVYLQFRTWKNFDWAAFWNQTGHVREHKFYILSAIALIYLAYVMRAIRWKIFLLPMRHTSVTSLLSPTIVGFTGLALLGRAGEMIRPYLIARKVELSFSSQLAVWAVERIFDIGSFALILLSAIFIAEAPRQLAYYGRFRQAGVAIVVLVIALSLGAALISWKGEILASWVESRLSHLASGAGKKIALRIREFRGGLNTIHNVSALFQLIAVSIAMWGIIALAYWGVMHSYGNPALDRPISQVPLLMASSMVGSMIQLPGVGGGSQLATISTLEHVFAAPHELAASCGILLWLVTFVSVVPLGLVFAHRERLSLRKISKASHQEELGASFPSPPSS